MLVFDDGNWNTPITVYVRAAADTAAEGVRVVMVSHSAISSDARFGGIILRDVAVSVIDDDRGEVLVTEIDPSTTNEDYSTTVLEGGFTDTIHLALTRAPELGETVTVNLLQNGLATGDLTFWLGATQVTSVQFTSLNWSTGVALTVKAFDDSVFENLETIVVTYTATSSNAGSAFAGMAGNVAEVTVYDNENPGVIVRESDGNTTVTVGGATDTYELFLTRAPGSDISITIATDGRSLIRLAGSGGAFASTLTVTFAAATWTVDSGIEIEVQGVPAPAGSADRLSFPYQPHVLDRVRGPLVVLGGPSPGAVYALVRGVTLPTETDDRTVNESQVSSGSGVDDASVDKLDVFHDGSRADSTGALTYRQAPGAGIALQNPGYAITGFGMGGDLVLDRGTPAAPDLLRFGGGITYTGFEVVEVLLGQKKENATIDATAANVVTVVHGGGDADTFTVLDNGGSNVVAGPLILYGDTSQNGLLSGGRYSGTSGVASVNALLFSNPGNDTINGAGTNAVLTIFGGPGNDILAGGRAGDQIAGGTGGDWIFGQAGDDHIYGDSEFNVDIAILVQLLRNPALTTEALEIVRGATPGSDLIRGDEGNDFILGDHGEITQTPGTRRIFSTANVVAITTTNPSLGAADAIYGGAGDDAILGGNGGDWLYGGNSTGPLATPFATQLVAVATSAATFGGGKFGVLRGVAITTTDRDLILGDNGRILWTTAFARELLETSDTADSTGAADVIEGNEDADVIAAGIGGDTVDAGAGNDVVVGDHARLEYQAASGALFLVTPIANELGGDDQIRGGAGEDILLGGTGHDAIDGGAGRDLVFGDNASLDRRTHLNNFNQPRFQGLTALGQIYGTDVNGAPFGTVLTTDEPRLDPTGQAWWSDFVITLIDHDASTTAAARTGNDYLAGGAGDDMIFGGLGNDTIQGDGSIDLVSAGTASACSSGGHPGSATVGSRVGACKDATYNVLLNPSVDGSGDGDDYIEGGGGDDVIFGNQGQDDIVGGSSNFFGLTTPAQRPDGADTIYGGSGTRIALDDPGDTSTTGHARDADVILGDNGKVIRLVSSAGLYLQFNYDSYGAAKVIPRAVALLDYSPRGDAEYVSTNPTNQAVSTLVTTDALRNTNIGGADFLHGESGDDIIHGQTGSDRIWGEGQSDDLYGESGYDWISGGTGVDGILGDDGLLLTSRNGTAEPLYGIAATTQTTLSLNGDQQTTIVNVTGSLSKQADVEPFYLGHNDVLYGGLGNDFLHGGAGDDAMSGAEALAFYYVGDPLALLGLYYKPGDVLQHGFRAAAPDEFRYFDENNPWRKVMVPVAGGVPIEFLLNFRARFTQSNPSAVVDDGRDTLFGDVGNDWIVGGTNRDYLFGGYGDDLLQADDDLDSTVGTADPLANDRPDARTATTGGPSFGDITFGGAGRDVQIANTITDRMYDLREFDSFFVPFSAFGAPTVNRSLPPDAEGYLYALSRALGADRTRGGTAARNGEPFGEIGLVTSADADWQSQSGSPGDPQPGNRNNQRDTNSTAEFGILTDADNGSTAAQLAVTDLTVTEANSGTTAITIVVTLSKASASTVTVTISTVAGTALAGSDYQTATATLTFAPGVTQRTFGVNIVNNTVVEPTEQFSVVLTNPAGAVIGDGTGVVTILDNDFAPLTAAAAATAQGDQTQLDQRQLDLAVSAAKAEWIAARPGVDFRGISVVVGDLDGLALGSFEGTTITIDTTAAGWGWTISGGAMDLVTVVAHELGHALGLEHEDGGLMAAVLAPGVRLLPATGLSLRPSPGLRLLPSPRLIRAERPGTIRAASRSTIRARALRATAQVVSLRGR